MRKLITLSVACTLLAACSISTEEYAKQQAKAFTEKNCPSHVRGDIRTDSLVFDEDTRTMHYYYSLFGMLDNPDSLNGRGDGMRQRMLETLKKTTSMDQFKKADMNFQYTYHSSSKPDTVLFDVTFRPSDYNK
jgi:hypothetical protein